jgi:hypothetical protein
VATGLGVGKGMEAGGRETLVRCNLCSTYGHRSNPSRLRLRGWTQEASGFSVPVHAVQPVQLKLEREKRRLLFSCRIFSMRFVPASNYRLGFRSQGRTGWPGWTGPTTAGVTLVQLRYLKVGRGSFRLDSPLSLPRVRDPAAPVISIRRLALNL